ncbi:tetratricopeptide repeat protein [Striga asiatica]|uniref:Tetratricopeptide repeat protein n=1 Tax=Striga asiatica TaxID=4170 RepID=A0A5A7QL60_STRAF|nr:tetratricopeptide repeat protein [Striga asiatica]
MTMPLMKIHSLGKDLSSYLSAFRESVGRVKGTTSRERAGDRTLRGGQRGYIVLKQEWMGSYTGYEATVTKRRKLAKRSEGKKEMIDSITCLRLRTCWIRSWNSLLHLSAHSPRKKRLLPEKEADGLRVVIFDLGHGGYLRFFPRKTSKSFVEPPRIKERGSERAESLSIQSPLLDPRSPLLDTCFLSQVQKKRAIVIAPFYNHSIGPYFVYGEPFCAYVRSLLERPRSLKTWIYFLLRCLALCRRVSGIPKAAGKPYGKALVRERVDADLTRCYLRQGKGNKAEDPVYKGLFHSLLSRSIGLKTSLPSEGEESHLLSPNSQTRL